MPKNEIEPPRGPMIHIRLDETTHRKLKIRVAHDGTTIQHLGADLICREVGDTDRSKEERDSLTSYATEQRNCHLKELSDATLLPHTTGDNYIFAYLWIVTG